MKCKIERKILKNCVLVVGEGDTSYNPGPPLTAIQHKKNKNTGILQNASLVKDLKKNCQIQKQWEIFFMRKSLIWIKEKY